MSFGLSPTQKAGILKRFSVGEDFIDPPVYMSQNTRQFSAPDYHFPSPQYPPDYQNFDYRRFSVNRNPYLSATPTPIPKQVVPSSPQRADYWVRPPPVVPSIIRYTGSPDGPVPDYNELPQIDYHNTQQELAIQATLRAQESRPTNGKISHTTRVYFNPYSKRGDPSADPDYLINQARILNDIDEMRILEYFKEIDLIGPDGNYISDGIGEEVLHTVASDENRELVLSALSKNPDWFSTIVLIMSAFNVDWYFRERRDYFSSLGDFLIAKILMCCVRYLNIDMLRMFVHDFGVNLNEQDAANFYYELADMNYLPLFNAGTRPEFKTKTVVNSEIFKTGINSMRRLLKYEILERAITDINYDPLNFTKLLFSMRNFIIDGKPMVPDEYLIKVIQCIIDLIEHDNVNIALDTNMLFELARYRSPEVASKVVELLYWYHDDDEPLFKRFVEKNIYVGALECLRKISLDSDDVASFRAILNDHLQNGDPNMNDVYLSGISFYLDRAATNWELLSPSSPIFDVEPSAPPMD